MPGPWTYRLEITDQVSQFTKQFRPPAPAFFVEISYGGSLVQLPALLDTGADLSVIPHNIALLLHLQKFSERLFGTAKKGPPEMRPIFKATLKFLDFTIDNHPMVSIERDPYMLIGRETLKIYKTTLDGPNLQFNIE